MNSQNLEEYIHSKLKEGTRVSDPLGGNYGCPEGNGILSPCDKLHDESAVPQWSF